MANLTKVAGVADADIEKIDGVAAADISKIGVTTKAAAVTGPTVAVAIGEDGRVIYSQTAGFASGSWTLYTLQAGSIDYKDLCYGKQSDGTETWMAAAGNTTNQLVLAQVAVPDDSGDWTHHNATGESGYACCYGHSGSTDSDTGIANFILVGNDCEYVSYFDGGITDTANWDGRRPLVSGMSTSKALNCVAFNNSIDDPLFMAATNRGRIAKSTTGGDGDSADWVVVRNKQVDATNAGSLGTDWGLNGIAFGNDMWVAVSAATSMWKARHQTSSNGDDWGSIQPNHPASNRRMYGVDTDGDGNWIICGTTGYIWQSDDNAASWTESQVQGVTDENTAWKVVKYDNSSAWYMGGSAGRLMKSTDNGDSWTRIPNPVEEQTGVIQINGIALNSIRTA